MRNTRKPTLVFVLLACLAPSVAAQKKPNLSGVWRRSLGQELLTIEHREPKIHLVYWIKDISGERTLDLTALTDGKEHKQTVLGQPATVVMRWDNTGLTWEFWREAGTVKIHNQRTFKLSADGQIITAERVDFNPNGTEGRRSTETWMKVSQAEQELQQIGNEMVAAFERNDAAMLDRIFADDFMGTNDQGQLYNKAELLGLIKSGAFKYESVKVDDAKLQIYGDVATTNARVSVKLQANGKVQESLNRNTVIWAKRQGPWRIVAVQGTPLAK